MFIIRYHIFYLELVLLQLESMPLQWKYLGSIAIRISTIVSKNGQSQKLDFIESVHKINMDSDHVHNWSCFPYLSSVIGVVLFPFSSCVYDKHFPLHCCPLQNVINCWWEVRNHVLKNLNFSFVKLFFCTKGVIHYTWLAEFHCYHHLSLCTFLSAPLFHLAV